MIKVIYYIFCVIGISILFYQLYKNKRSGILIFLVSTTFSLFAFPWYLFPIENAAYSAYLLSMMSAAIYIATSIDKGISIKKDRFLFLKYLLFYLLLLIIYLLVGGITDYGIHKTIFYLLNNLLPITLLMFIVTDNEKDFRNIFYTIIFCSFLGALKLFIINATVLDRSGLDLSPLVYGRNIGIGSILIVTYLLHSNSLSAQKKIGYMFLAAFLVFSVLRTGSRAPSIGIFLTILSVIFFYNLKIKTKFKATYKLFAITGIIVIGALSFIDLNEFGSIYRVIGFTEQTLISGEGNYDQSRSFQLKEVIKGIKVSSGMGTGTGTFQFFSSYRYLYPHNIFLEIFLELGIIGAILFLILFTKTYLRILKIFRDRQITAFEIGLMSLWIYGFINGMVSGDISKNILWISMALVWMIPNNNNNSTHKSP